ANVFVPRKGAVRAGKGDMGIIPGSMGARSYIVRGLGNNESFHSCSHGAGRAMSRKEAKRRFSIDDHIKATAGVECRKDADVIDETPMAYKPIDDVMRAQSDLVEIVHTLRQVICVKGWAKQPAPPRWSRGAGAPSPLLSSRPRLATMTRSSPMFTVDGSFGEGGGQILRTSL